jgi:hypothetical protein
MKFYIIKLHILKNYENEKSQNFGYKGWMLFTYYTRWKFLFMKIPVYKQRLEIYKFMSSKS